jgi:hypothetical protein
MLFLSINLINIPEKSSVAFPVKNDISFADESVIFTEDEGFISNSE